MKLGPASRLATIAAALALASAPRIAHASDMSGLVVIVVGMFVGIPAGVLLLVSIVVSLSVGASPAPWHRTYANATMFAAPFLGLVFPLSLVVFDGSEKIVGAAFLFDAPVMLLGLIAFLLALRLHRRVVTRDAGPARPN